MGGWAMEEVVEQGVEAWVTKRKQREISFAGSPAHLLPAPQPKLRWDKPRSTVVKGVPALLEFELYPSGEGLCAKMR